jgi:Flp pilus assembly pilin Flp
MVARRWRWLDPRRVPQRNFSAASSLTAFAARQDGQDVVEYGLLIATIVLVVLVAIGAFGSQIQAWFSTLAVRITTTGTG